MCMAVPARIRELHGTKALVEVLGFREVIDTSLVPGACPGDYVLIHAGFAIRLLDADEGTDLLRDWTEALGM